MTELELRLKYKFQKPEMLERALTHRSFANEMKLPVEHNEKLEFLGDAVLDLILGEYLLELFPLDNEGALSKKRASLVNEETLAKLAVCLDLPKHLHLGKGEMITNGAQKPRLLASAFEAIAGAIFLDGGYISAKEFVRREFVIALQGIDPNQDFVSDYKTRLQEYVQKQLRTTPTYELLTEEGPSHDRKFTILLKIKDEVISQGTGRSKKIAEQVAAKIAIETRFSGVEI